MWLIEARVRRRVEIECLLFFIVVFIPEVLSVMADRLLRKEIEFLKRIHLFFMKQSISRRQPIE